MAWSLFYTVVDGFFWRKFRCRSMVFEELFWNERHERTESNYISKNKPLKKEYNYSFRSFILVKIKFENLSNTGALFWLTPDQTRLLFDDKEWLSAVNLLFQISIFGRY